MTTPRHDRVRKIAEHRGIALEGPMHTTSDEDLRETLEAPVLGRWAAITQHDEIYYVYPEDTLEDAQDRATRYATDSIHAEQPVEVVDLDTGTVLWPVWSSLQWAAVESSE